MPDLRKLRLRPKRRKIPRPLEPTGIKLAYFQLLRGVVLARAKQLLRERLFPRLRDLLARAPANKLDAAHLDALPPGRRLNLLMDRISAAFWKEFPQDRLESLLSKIGARTSDFQKQQIFRQVKAATGVALTALADRGLKQRMRAFTAENVGLIKSIPQTYFDQVEAQILRAMRDGTRHENLAEEIERRFRVSEERARLIARDQVGKFYGELNRARQRDLGIDRFVWRTVQDERVRPEHETLEGEIFTWAEGHPEEGIPGEAVNCRCFGEPILDDLLAEQDA